MHDRGMRRVAIVPNPAGEIRRVILHETEKGTYLYLSTTVDDRGASFDEWYVTSAEAFAAAKSAYGVTQEMWTTIRDPLPGCQDDWVSPVRVPGRESGKPLWGSLERLVDGEWVPFKPDATE
jgi:hypothetical protein